MSKLSLCLIVGNESALIRRCLDTFARGIPVDELVVVRACGARPADDTLEICRREYGAITSEYLNAPATAHWPHVDNFGAARQMAFDLSTGDVTMWVDCDDTAEPHTLQTLRRIADDMPADVVMIPYQINSQHVITLRERLIRRGRAKWVNAVHEYCHTVEGATVAEVRDIAIIHSPAENKSGSNDRNLRILEAIPHKNNSELLYYHLELLGAKRFKEAVAAGEQALTKSTLAPENRYEIFLNLASLADSAPTREALLMEAVKIQPWRREALARLVSTAMDGESPLAALAYARMMTAQPVPPPPLPWTHRYPVYGWAGQMMLAEAHRFAGDHKRADQLEREYLKAPRFTILHATRSRPHRAAEIRKFFIDRADDPQSVEYIFAIDSDDEESLRLLRRFRHVVVPPAGGVVAPINAAAKLARGEILIMAADDCLPPPRWDSHVWEAFRPARNQPRVLAVSDGYRDDALITHPIMNRAFYKAQGYFFCPEYPHLYCDTELSLRAYKAGRVIEAKHLIFRHNNPIFTGEPQDQLARARNNVEAYRIGKEIYDRRNPTAA